MPTKIKDDYFEYGTQKYFRGNAHRLELATFGEKKDSITSRGYLEPEARVAAEHLDGRIKTAPPVKINWNEVSQADLGVDIDLKFFSLGRRTAGTFSHAQAKTAKLELVNLAINEGPLKKMLNQDANAARKFLADEGGDARIVSEVWIVVDAQLGEFFATRASGLANVTAFESLIEATFSGGKSGSQTLRLAPGSVFAYKMHKVKDWDNGKTVIDNIEGDAPGWS